jgi:nucleoid-associated protein YgaU
MDALARTARVVGTVLVEAVAVVALVAVGRSPTLSVPFGDLGPWLRDGDPATVVVALTRWAALLGAAWLLGSTLLYLAASVVRAPAAVRAVGWSTLPVVRRTIDAACAVSVATALALAPAVAAGARVDDPPSVSVVRDGRGLAQLPPDSTAAPPTTAAVAPPPTPAVTPPPLPSVPTAPREAVDTVVVVVVASGDNLWLLATRRLARATGRDPASVPDAEVAPYWVRVCDVNRDRLASGDPNLVFPGEQVVLPPVS